jgi:hypothetical protein
MAQLLLDEVHRVSFGCQLGGKGMPETVRMNPLPDPGFLR